MKILMVCMGNICRSPMAEGIMKNISAKNGKEVYVDSAGTLDYHEGEAPDPRAVKKAKDHGIDISNQRARPFVTEDFSRFDTIFVMDDNNYKEIMMRARDEGDKAKVKMIMNEAYPNENIEVPDPYYGGEQGFENVFRMLTAACEAVVKKC